MLRYFTRTQKILDQIKRKPFELNPKKISELNNKLLWFNPGYLVCKNVELMNPNFKISVNFGIDFIYVKEKDKQSLEFYNNNAHVMMKKTRKIHQNYIKDMMENIRQENIDLVRKINRNTQINCLLFSSTLNKHVPLNISFLINDAYYENPPTEYFYFKFYFPMRDNNILEFHDRCEFEKISIRKISKQLNKQLENARRFI